MNREAEPSVTIVLVPRERFGPTLESLDRLYEVTPRPFRLVCVDAGSPPRLAKAIARESVARGFRLIRTERYLTPNQARRLGLREASGRYVVFLDNDVLVTPGWLDALVRCAEETQADLVGPLYCVGKPELETVHMAGGIARIETHGGRRVLREEHRWAGRRLSEVRPELRREPTELVEFHCMLVRADVFERVGPLDARLLCSAEHIDLCLAVRQAGGAVYFEPGAAVTYVPPPPLLWSDAAYFATRWSEAWNRATRRRFQKKWALGPGDAGLRDGTRWLRSHRRLLIEPLLRPLRAAFPGRVGRALQLVLAAAEIAANWLLIRAPAELEGDGPAR
jgi:GT2 family glycosyltransferase